jgi:hypothetical protein
VQSSPTKDSTPSSQGSRVYEEEHALLIKPVNATDTTETGSIETVTNNGFLKDLSYPTSFAVMSKTMLAAARPRK